MSISHSGEWPQNLMEEIERAISTVSPKPTNPEFEFNMTMEAAEKNFLLLSTKYDRDLERAIYAQQSSPVGYGSKLLKESSVNILFGVE